MSQAALFDGEPSEDVEKFKYLGSMFVANGQGIEEIRSRINLARFAFSRLQSCLWSRPEILLRTKDRVYQPAVRSILLSGCETWPVRIFDERMFEALDNGAPHPFQVVGEIEYGYRRVYRPWFLRH